MNELDEIEITKEDFKLAVIETSNVSLIDYVSVCLVAQTIKRITKRKVRIGEWATFQDDYTKLYFITPINHLEKAFDEENFDCILEKLPFKVRVSKEEPLFYRSRTFLTSWQSSLSNQLLSCQCFHSNKLHEKSKHRCSFIGCLCLEFKPIEITFIYKIPIEDENEEEIVEKIEEYIGGLF